jgi:hypothetical protein
MQGGYVLLNPPCEIGFCDLASGQAKDHGSCHFRAGRKFYSIKTKKHDDRGECRSLVAIDKGMIPRNPKCIGCRQHRQSGFTIPEFIKRPTQSRL